MAPTPGDLRPETVAVAAGRPPREPGAPLNVSPMLASVFHAGAYVPGMEEDPEYGRDTNATWQALEQALGTLEGGHCVLFASGVAAISAVVDELGLPGPVVAPADAYTGSRALLARLEERGRLTSRLVDIADTEATLAACDGARLLWVETPTNPLLAIADLRALATGAHAAGVAVAVDNTFATPLLQRPLDLGADVAVHSVTKLIAGHSDVLMGAAVTADAGLARALRAHRYEHGAIPGPLAAYLALRGLRTLPLRLERAQANAGVLAERLDTDPRVTRVWYPGLAAHPGHDRAAAQMKGHGAMVAFDVAGPAGAAARVCTATRLAVYATSLGGIETTLEDRARQPGEGHLPPELIRLSVGCEHVEDLWADLDQALGAAAERAAPPAWQREPGSGAGR